MRYLTLVSVLAVGLAAACGSSSDAMGAEEAPFEDLDLKLGGEEPLAAEDRDLEDIELDEEALRPAAHPADVVEPQTDLSTLPATEPTEPTAEAVEPAQIGDPRLQAEPVAEGAEAKPGAQPSEHP